MIQGLLGKKLGMTQVFSPEGNPVAVTIVEAGPCWVIQKKVRKKDGYEAVQLGFDPQKPSRMTKPRLKHLEKAKVAPVHYLREVPASDLDAIQVGKSVGPDIFQVGERVDIIGNSKGHGFTGVMKRHGFSGAPGSHGAHESFRGPGSIGSSAFPSRVFKGMRMAGRMGNERVTVQNLQIVRIIPEKNLLFVRGAVPGPNGGLLLIRKSKKKALAGS
ncbi:MAG: 50S ribosomal protein L3 [Candidatus Tectomicrobia bacterium]|uniref:Large ribosomal subunit protein uL3 n=1 Tax=Tectimicrobiota bacterium TaxID=2528274 RepID=A0A932FWQ3_UNCTE|nr:50S ribosomal protein L3 [Candidatus Tectomicrobia bacterium]